VGNFIVAVQRRPSLNTSGRASLSQIDPKRTRGALPGAWRLWLRAWHLRFDVV